MRGQVILAAVAAAAAAFPAAAQQHADEPTKIEPLFGQSYEEPPPREVKYDQEYEPDKRWTPLSGFVGVMTFLTPEETNLSIGVGPVYKPDYFGSDDYEWDVDPAAFVRVRNFMFFDDDGADFGVIGFSNFTIGPSIRVVGKRDQDDNPALTGLGDVGTTFEFGGFAATTFLDRYMVRFKVRHGLKTGHRGTIVDATGTALLFRYGRVSTSVSARTTWIGNRYADAYFSVTPEQSAASGHPLYDAERGFRDIGGSLNGYVNVGKSWSINPYFTYQYIFDNIADTPIIADHGDRHQFTAGFHLMREFRFGFDD